jgi:uncharacterized protein (TIGR04255 family)
MQNGLSDAGMTTESLPEFEKPPVNEVVFGMLTQPIRGFSLAHFGRFWERVSDSYPRCEEAPPLLPLIETFGDRPATINVEIAEVPIPRVWLISTAGNEVIQLQRDRFHSNWRRVKPEDVYPRYSVVRETFVRTLSSFHDFLRQFGMDLPMPVQYELSYINHISISNKAALGEELRRILRDFSWESDARFLTEADQFTSSLAFLMPGGHGRLHVVTRLGQHRETSERVLSLELVARGLPAALDLDEMWRWFDLAHEWIDPTTEFGGTIVAVPRFRIKCSLPLTDAFERVTAGGQVADCILTIGRGSWAPVSDLSSETFHGATESFVDSLLRRLVGSQPELDESEATILVLPRRNQVLFRTELAVIPKELPRRKVSYIGDIEDVGDE